MIYFNIHIMYLLGSSIINTGYRRAVLLSRMSVLTNKEANMGQSTLYFCHYSL